MSDNFIVSMVSEGGKISHKRVISVLLSLAAAFTVVFAVVKYPAQILDILHSTYIFIGVMSGVATVGQIVSLVRGGNTAPEPQQQTPLPDETAK